MNKNTSAIGLLESEMNKTIAKSEFKRIQAFILALGVGMTIFFVNFFLIPGNASFFKNSYTRLIILGWFAVFLVYELIGFVVARRYLFRKEVLPQRLKILNVVLESAFPGLILFLLTFTEESAIFLDSPLLFIYFILIVLASLNLEVRLALIIGLVASGSYFLVTFWAITNYDPEHQILHFPPILYYIRSLFMFLAAVGSAFVTHELRGGIGNLLQIQQKQRELERLFGQQVSKKVAETLLENNHFTSRSEATVLFMDIRNFSTFAENNTPEQVNLFQNQFFNPLIQIIQNENGITNQIIGDGLMATFGAPVYDALHAQAAFNAAVKILDKIEYLVSIKKIPPTKVGIGLHTGEVVMGNIGNELRKQFSVSGTTVVIAARIEQANKEHNTQFLVSGETLRKINQSHHDFISLGPIAMKNIKRPIEVFEVRAKKMDETHTCVSSDHQNFIL